MVSSSCSEAQNELVFTKWTGDTALNETFYLYQPQTDKLLYTSPVFEKESNHTVTACIQKTEFDLYDLVLSTPLWHHGSIVEFRNKYGHIVLKTPHKSGVVSLSLYTPILKNSTWVLLSGREFHWVDLEWNEGSQSEYSAWEIPSVSPSAFLFVRKTISLPSREMAAFEIQVKYKDGVIAYVNGYEVLRDNMKSGYVAATTRNTGSYSSYAYRGAIRNGGELGSMLCVVAIEIHSKNTITDFDAYLSLYDSVTHRDLENKIYYYPVHEVYGDGRSDHVYREPVDYDMFTTIYSDVKDIMFEFRIDRGQVNGFMYSVQQPYGVPTVVEMEGYSSLMNRWFTFWDGDVNIDNDIVNWHRHLIFPYNYDKVHLTISDVSSLPWGISEVRPMIWRAQIGDRYPFDESVFYEFGMNESIQELILDPSHFFYCEFINTHPISLSMSSKCALSGKVDIPGQYILYVGFADIYGPCYLTIYLTIHDSVSEDQSYDEGYRTAPIVLTIILCVCIVIVAVLLIMYLMKPGNCFMKNRTLPITTQEKKAPEVIATIPGSPGQPVRTIPGSPIRTFYTVPSTPGQTICTVPSEISIPVSLTSIPSTPSTFVSESYTQNNTNQSD